jgi:hypothetical protein
MIEQKHPRIEDESLVFTDQGNLSETVEGHLRHYYSRRLFVQNIEQLENGYSIRVGITYPRDVSDCRAQDNVLKMVNIGDVETFQATPAEGDYYEINLPDRSHVYSAFQEQQSNLLAQLDGTMATAIYEKVYKMSPVRTQLNAVVELIDYVRNDGPLELHRLKDIQSTRKTQQYVEALEDLDFLRVDESGMVQTGGKIDAADDQGWSDEKLIGQVIKDGYKVLRQKFGLTMLNHFPVFANGYYLSAFRRKKSDLYLTKDDIVRNLQTEYHRNTDPLKVDRKLESLDEVGVVQYDGDEVSSVPEIYDEVSQNLPAVG